MKEVPKYSGCFVCGDKNAHGLQAKFFFDGEKAFTEVTAADMFEGYSGIYHGGVTATLLDEVMIKAILAREIFAVTVEMTVRYQRAIRTGDHLTFTGRLIRSKGRVYFTKGQVTNDTGEVVATAEGKYVEAKAEFKDELMQSLE